MKYVCFCHREDYKELTKSELKSMLRGKNRVDFADFVKFYNIPPQEIYRYLLNNGIKINHQERPILIKIRDKQSLHKETDNLSWVKNWENVENIPVGLVCAIYNVSREKVRGKWTFDADELRLAQNDLQQKIDRYYDEKPEIVYSDLRGIDLIAMRYYRGVKRTTMARKMLMPVNELKKIERETRIPKDIAFAYMDILKVTNRHIKQLRSVMQGKLTKVTENREIPQLVKVAVWSRDKGACRSCGAKDKLHYHHIKRFSEGGQNTKENLMLLCASCHAEEHKGEKGYHLLKKMAEE